MPLQNSQVWISNLYVRLAGVDKSHSTLIAVLAGDVYLTDMTFVADGDKARAVDVKKDSRIFIARESAVFSPVPMIKTVLGVSYFC